LYGLCDDNHKETTTNQKNAYPQGHPRVGENNGEYARTKDKRRKKTKRRPTYVVNQYTFTNNLQSGKLESSQAEVNLYLREPILTHCEKIPWEAVKCLFLRHVNQ